MSPSTDGGARPTKVLSRTSTSRSGVVKGALEYGYPNGHQGHLTAEEETSLEGFKTLLAKNNLYTPGPPPSHSDATLLRFLRARRWDLPAAHQQFAQTAAWRASIDLDTLYATIDVAAYGSSRKLYPQWTGRRDRRGIPIYLYEIVHLDAKSVAAYEKQEVWSKAQPPKEKKDGKLLRLFALYENLTRFTQPLCSQLPDREYAGRTPVTLSTNIVDVHGVSLKMYWNLKNHMQAASELATAHYPETLDRIFIIGAPSFFTTVWGWIKRWFDPVTVSKIFILSPAEVLPTLKSFMDVANIPKKYGGELDFTWNDRPNLDAAILEAVQWQNGHTTFPEGPLYWEPIEGDPLRLRCVARGSVDKKQRDEVVGTIAVAVAPNEEQGAEVAAAPAMNGMGAEPVVGEPKVVDAPPIASEADATMTAAVPAAAPPQMQEKEEHQEPLQSPAVSDLASPASEKFVDAPEIPALPSPLPPAEVLVPGVQELSLADKALEAGEVPIANGKPLTAV